MISPVLQQTQVLLQGLAAQASADRAAFRNMDRRPWLVDEVRFNTVDPTYSYTVGYGGFVGARIKCCGLDLTADFVPLWSLDPYQNPNYLRDENTYVYRPARPILVPPEQCLAVDLATDVVAMNALEVQPPNFNLSVAICGRPTDAEDVPASVDVPWVAKWQPLFTQAGGNQQSAQNDLVNPFDVDLAVDRLVGNVGFGGNGAGYFDASIDFPCIPERMLAMQLNDTQGGVLVRDPTPFGHVFSAVDRTWRARTILPPSAYLLMSLDLDQWTPIAESIGNAVYVNVGLHGHRKVSREAYHG